MFKLKIPLTNALVAKVLSYFDLIKVINLTKDVKDQHQF